MDSVTELRFFFIFFLFFYFLFFTVVKGVISLFRLCAGRRNKHHTAFPLSSKQTQAHKCGEKNET